MDCLIALHDHYQRSSSGAASRHGGRLLLGDVAPSDATLMVYRRGYLDGSGTPT